MVTPAENSCCNRFLGTPHTGVRRDVAPAGGAPSSDIPELARTCLRLGHESHRLAGCGFRYTGSAGAFSVTAQGYQEVLADFDNVRFVARDFGEQNVGAMYIPSSNRVQFNQRPLELQTRRRSLIHEMLHRRQDREGFSGRRWEFEATAYLGDMLWHAATTVMAPEYRGVTLRAFLQEFQRMTPDSLSGISASILLAVGADASVVVIQAGQVQALMRKISTTAAYARDWNNQATGDGR